MYRGGTIFCDDASGFVSIHHQQTFTSDETILSKMKFEREAMGLGVEIKRYYTDNGVYTSKDFLKKITSENQTIRHSGVGDHHHNGVDEELIGNIVRSPRSILWHESLRWPHQSKKDLWPMEMTHAVHLHNSTPNMVSGLSPMEVWASSKSSHSSLKNAHPWGCPVYVLNPELQDGQKIPKWEPRSRVGQYMGISPMHANTVGLVRNLKTGRISPQYHLVYDDNFQTVHFTHLFGTVETKSRRRPSTYFPPVHILHT